ncbi:sigma-54-dependent Fis family transcriptional regulator [Noviherbaspirillum sp. DKR-6]|uniref:Sigma-54-dependent Fis family transcriptional regulator n=2 Tax=Noviherbaspirillum pedocola TaxID=2801341 RepID=A0A934SR90_9BURK|nr:sigma-54-dependent Fis family transcriptional regulator [Noviherbaspirillum pedocola]MBK4734014.1 sigma-54-dependent Fis family transcriptional regulator [Noviherbaspirillum pedocola]
MLDESHQRCAAYGLSTTEKPDFDPIARNDLSLIVEQNRVLYTHALPVMETLYDQIINTHNMVVLTDANGLIVHALGDDDFLEKANRVALQPGVSWSEEGKGTNAIGTAIVEKKPTLVHANQHYLRANHFLTCSAAPIFNHQGDVIGVLDVTGDKSSYHQHTMALVRMSAQMIENHLFSAAFDDAITLHFHSRPEFIGTLMEGIASFSPSGRFLSASRSGLFQLGLPLSALKTHTFSSLFGLPVSALFDHYRTACPGLLNLCLHNGVRVFVRAEMRRTNLTFHAMPEALARDAAPRVAPQPAASETQPRRMSSLRYLNTGDAQVERLIEKLSKVIGRDIPILVTGETGTGKDLLAQAIHNDSPRAKGPFVAVNCASIPETLIESELFGYEDGAFTGARKKGSIGKILQANGGTLFLDEIGDMPMSLQVRLLRVLQDRMVTPLGSTKSIPVNVALICATNRNLREMIALNTFREDLYYRLNGLVVKLPPLRERSDLDAVIEKLLATEAEGRPCRVSDEVMRMFRQHKWPGNFRQLTNLLRTAIVMLGDDAEILPEHLPDDFLDDISHAQRQNASDTIERIVSDMSRLEDVEASVIRKSLEAHGGNVSATARALGVSRNTIYRKMQH